MKKIILTFSLALFISSLFSQEKCTKSSIETLIQDKLALSRQKESTSQKNYEKSVEKLAKLKKWDENEKISYLMKMVSTESFKKSTAKKFSTLQEAIDLLKRVDTEKATSANCKLKLQVQKKLDQVIANNGAEWEKVMVQVKKDYKAITNKELRLNEEPRKKETKKSNDPLRPSILLGVWVDYQDKEENYVFNADGTVYSQRYGTNRNFNKRYWYAKDGKICFTFSNQTKGGLCIEYSIKENILTVQMFGEAIKYKKQEN